MQTKIKDLRPNLIEYLELHQLTKKWNKAKRLFEQNIYHNSLNFELLEPKHLNIYSFRIDLKYRAVFIFVNSEVEIISFTNHYK